MKTRTIICAVVLAALLPVQALAAVCFQLAPAQDVLVIEVDGQPAGGYFNLVGEDVGTCGPGTAMPLNGTAHFRSDGNVHFGVIIHSTTSSCAPFTIQGILDPPFFTSGSGFVGNAIVSGIPVTFAPVSCPGIGAKPDTLPHESGVALGRSLASGMDLHFGRGGSWDTAH